MDPRYRSDQAFMQAALALGRRGLGRVAPNPAVGCFLVKDNRVLARGWTQPGGRPHAETEALDRAGPAAQGATAYVSLEPCAHVGETPPCCEALIAAGIGRCVIALVDSDPRVSGQGVAALRAAGIPVEVGALAEQAAYDNGGFLMRVTQGRPLVTLKLATTLDGRIATRSGESQWITGPLARGRAHLLRAGHDAVMVGSGTAVADDPRLNVRLPGLEDRAPARVVLDGRLRLPLTHHLVAHAAEQPTYLFSRKGNDPDRIRAYRDSGVDVLTVGLDDEGHLSLAEVMQSLGDLGMTRLLVEGGGRLAAGLMRQDLIDRLVWFRAPRVFGGDGLPAVSGFGLDRLDHAPGFSRTASLELGDDRLEYYRRDISLLD